MKIKLATEIVFTIIYVVCTMLTLVVFLPPLILDYFSIEKIDPRSKISNMTSYKWTEKYFSEYRELNIKYYDFFVWRRSEFRGSTITVDKAGYRQHSKIDRKPSDANIWVFGGSTIWGTGVNNTNTIPYHLEQITKKNTFNFGESGYITHQNLNLLIKELVNYKPEKVIFYDGVNNIFVGCQPNIDFYSTLESKKIQTILQNAIRNPDRLKTIYGLSMHYIQQLFLNHPTSPVIINYPLNNMICFNSSERAKQIVKVFVNDWKLAKFLAESNGIKFYPILQPHVYTGHPNVAQLEYMKDNVANLEIKKQVNYVYDEIRAALHKEKIEFLDLSNSLNNDEQLYIDEFHLNPEGNKLIAKKIADYLK